MCLDYNIFLVITYLNFLFDFHKIFFSLNLKKKIGILMKNKIIDSFFFKVIKGNISLKMKTMQRES